MSKAVISEKAEPRELKALFILGPKIEPAPEILKLYDREDCLVIGNGLDNVKISEIDRKLKSHNVQIGPNTRIDISVHGLKDNKEHILLLDEKGVKTKTFLQELQKLSSENPLYTHIWACYGGTANKDIEALKPGSIIVTHV